MPISGNPVHPTGLDIVANLERIAALGGNGLHTPSHTQNTIVPGTTTDTTAPVPSATTKQPRKRNVTKNNNKKKNKNKRKRTDNGSGSETEEDLPTFDPAHWKDSGKTAVELRYLAEKHASSGLPDEIFESILEFHEELQTLIAIKALELGCTVSDIEGVFGKYIGVRRPSRWNRFLQSPKARATFKAARGVGSGEGMRQLSALWKSMSEAEKDVYKEAVQEMDSASLQAMDKDLADLEVGARTRDQILQSGSNTVINARSFKKYKDNTEKYLDNVMKHCIPIAKSNHFEMVIVAVSNHVYKHSFQFTRTTIGLKKVVEEIYAIDGANNFATEVQAHLVGRKPGELTKCKAESGREHQSRVVAALSRHLKQVTGLNNWPWSKCDVTLKESGYKLELLPGARSVEGTFKDSSRNLNRAKLLALESDLENNLIQLVKLNQPTAAQTQRIENTNTNTTDIEEPHRSTSDIDNIPDTTNLDSEIDPMILQL